MADQFYSRGKDGKGLLLHELLDELNNLTEEEISSISSVVINPPIEGADVETDQDSDQSDTEATCNFDHLPRRVLLSKCIVMTTDGNTDTTQITAGTSADVAKSELPSRKRKRIAHNQNKQNITSTHSRKGTIHNQVKQSKVKKPVIKRKTANQIRKKAVPNKLKKHILKKTVKKCKTSKDVGRNWNKKETVFSIPMTEAVYLPTAEDLLKNTVMKPVDGFLAMFTNKFIEEIVIQSNMYAAQKGNHSMNITSDEIKVILGVMLFSGYHRLPSKRMYRKTDPDCHSDLVANAIRRNRFDDILRYLHMSDNSTYDGSDSFHKVRPIFDHLNNSFKQISIDESCCIDESIIPYFGHHGAKQFIRGKPIRFGFKLWVLANSGGFIYHAEPYCGKSTRLPESEYGQGGSVVLGLAEHANVPKGTKLYFDNLFTSIGLVDELTKLSYGATGTLRENRVPNVIGLSAKKVMAKLQRGSLEMKTDGKIQIVRWNDNAVVTVLSNCIPMEPMKNADRYSRAEKKKIQIKMPGSIAAYNQNMGGVDLNDQFVATYRCSIRIKKWWWPFFSWAVDESCVQGWLLYRKFGKNIPLLEFRRQCALFFLRTCGTEVSKPGSRPSSSLMYSPVLEDLRRDGKDHIIIKGQTKYRRCRVCGNRTSFECKKCQVALHANSCFATFHANQ